MASTYSTNLKIELMSTGENSGIWGNTTNTNLGTALEQAIVGYGNPDFIADANLTISITNSNAAQAARALVLNVTSVFGSLTATRELVVPASQKQYIVQNNTAGAQSITVKTSGGTGITVPNGRRAHLYVDGTTVVQMFDFVDINGGAIDGTPIGGASAAAGAFTTLNTSSTTNLAGLTSSTALALDASKNVVSVANTGTGSNVLNTSPTLVTPALGTPSSGVVTNLTGTASININGTVGATTPAAGAFTTLSASGTSTLAAVNSGALAVTGAISSTTDATLSGLTVGKGAGAVATNTAVGASALAANTSGYENLASGKGALQVNTTGYQNTAIGYGALIANTTGPLNVAVGTGALQSSTTADANTAVGSGAMLFTTTGSGNTVLGRIALFYNTTGANNVALGKESLFNNTTGIYNTASGVNALFSNTTGSNNTASGQGALYYNTTGNNNTASGRGALLLNTTGNDNTASGRDALLLNTTGSGNTAINPNNSAGGYAPVFSPSTENDRFCMGSTGVTNAYIQVAWTVVSDARDKINFAPVPHGLEFVKALQPTAYQFRTARDSEETNGGVRYGFKAQDVLALEGANPVIVDNEDADKLRMIDTALIPVLVKALQELNAKFDAYVLTHP